MTLSPDQTLLYVADSRTHWVYSYQIQPDGSLAHKQKYYHLHVPDTADDSGADGMRVDRDGRLYVATRMGIQVCDQAGRVNCIIPTPNGKVSNLCFGGEDFDTLFATCGDRVYRRKVKTRRPRLPGAPQARTAPAVRNQDVRLRQGRPTRRLSSKFEESILGTQRLPQFHDRGALEGDAVQGEDQVEEGREVGLLAPEVGIDPSAHQGRK